MSRVRFTLPQVKDYPDSRPSACPHCRSVFLNRHGSVTKRVTDPYISEVTAIRYRCADCLRTFRHYPEGVDSHDRSRRLRALGALSWALGLSLRSVSHLLAALGCRLSRMSVWRDVQESGSGALSGWLNSARSRVMGADETMVRLRGKKTVVGFVADAKSGQLVGMDVLVDRDSEGFVRWLQRYVSRFGVEAMVTDDLSSYKPVAERLGVEHQVCRRLDEIDGWDGFKAMIWRFLTELPEDGGRKLLRTEPSVRIEPRLRRLVVELCEKWPSLLCHQRVAGMPQTERTIGRSKIRYKTVRGYKSEEGMMNGLGLTQWVWSGQEGLDLSELIAA